MSRVQGLSFKVARVWVKVSSMGFTCHFGKLQHPNCRLKTISACHVNNKSSERSDLSLPGFLCSPHRWVTCISCQITTGDMHHECPYATVDTET